MKSKGSPILHSSDEEQDNLDEFDEPEMTTVEESECDTIYSRMDSNRPISPIKWDKESEPEEAATSNVNEEEPHRLPIERVDNDKTNSKVNRIESTYEKTTIRREDDSRNVIPVGPRLPPKMNQLFRNARYYLIKSNNFDNVKLAMDRSVWATPRSNENRLNEAFSKATSVFLIFSVKESGKFQGYARIASHADPRFQINWVLPPRMNQNLLSGAFRLDWVSRSELSFSKTGHLINSWNENKPVKIGRDGQEIEPSCGEKLCRLFPLDNQCKVDILLDKSHQMKKRCVGPPALLGPPPVQPMMLPHQQRPPPHHINHHQQNQPQQRHLLQAPPPPPPVYMMSPYLQGPPQPRLVQPPPLLPPQQQSHMSYGPPTIPSVPMVESSRPRWPPIETPPVPRDIYRQSTQPVHHRIRERDHAARSRSPRLHGMDPDLLLSGNYQDYLRLQAAQTTSQRDGHSTQSFDKSGMESYLMSSKNIPPTGEKQYEDRVNDFLRGLGNRDRTRSSGQRRSRSRSRGKMVESSRHSKTRHRRSYSRSRSRERR